MESGAVLERGQRRFPITEPPKLFRKMIGHSVQPVG